MSNIDGLPPNVGELAMSASSMATFRECPRKYELAFLKQLTPEGFYAPFYIGDKVHNGLERFYKGDHPRDIARDIQDEIWAELQTIFVPDSEQTKVDKEVSIVAGMLLGYFKYYGPAERKKWTDLHVELGFDLPWIGGETRNWGRLDFAGHYTDSGQFWVMEHKTTGLGSGDYLAKWHLGMQPHNYVWAAVQAHKLGVLKDKAVGAVINVIRKPGIRLKKTETQEQFNLRLINEYVQNPTKYFAREWIPIGEAELAWYEETQNHWVQQLKACNKSSFFPQNTDACVSHFGACKYWPICWGYNRCGDVGVLSYFRIREKQFEEVPDVGIRG